MPGVPNTTLSLSHQLLMYVCENLNISQFFWWIQTIVGLCLSIYQSIDTLCIHCLWSSFITIDFVFNSPVAYTWVANVWLPSVVLPLLLHWLPHRAELQVGEDQLPLLLFYIVFAVCLTFDSPVACLSVPSYARVAVPFRWISSSKVDLSLQFSNKKTKTLFLR